MHSCTPHSSSHRTVSCTPNKPQRARCSRCWRSSCVAVGIVGSHTLGRAQRQAEHCHQLQSQAHHTQTHIQQQHQARLQASVWRRQRERGINMQVHDVMGSLLPTLLQETCSARVSTPCPRAAACCAHWTTALRNGTSKLHLGSCKCIPSVDPPSLLLAAGMAMRPSNTNRLPFQWSAPS